MTAFTIKVHDEEIQAKLKELGHRSLNMSAVLQTIGEGMVERTKRRFETSTGPDGVKWKPNSDATLSMLSNLISGSKSKRKKDGSLNAAGKRQLANKKPLISSGLLAQQIFPHVANNVLTVATTSVTAKYSAIQQFGGKAGRGHKVTIPARPYLPIHQDGTLYPEEQAEIVSAINAYLMEGMT